MSTFVQDSIMKPTGRSYAGMTMDSIRADIDNKRIEVFETSNSPVESKVNDEMPVKELEICNKYESESKENRKQTWKTVGLVALGVATVVGGILVTKKLHSNSKNIKEIIKNPIKEAEKLTDGNVISGTQILKDNITNNNTIARKFEDLPPLREGYIRLVHRTSRECGESIAKTGLYSRAGLDDTASAMYKENDFWNLLANGAKMHRGHETEVIIDMPRKEFDIISRCHYSKTYNPFGNSHIYYAERPIPPNTDEIYFLQRYLVCPSKYVVGVCEHPRNLSLEEINKIKIRNAQNPLPNVEETDLRIFDRFKIHNPEEQEFEWESGLFSSDQIKNIDVNSEKCWNEPFNI